MGAGLCCRLMDLGRSFAMPTVPAFNNKTAEEGKTAHIFSKFLKKSFFGPSLAPSSLKNIIWYGPAGVNIHILPKKSCSAPVCIHRRASAKRKHQPADWCSLFGASGQTRTGDLLITNQLLYRLSYTSACAPVF